MTKITNHTKSMQTVRFEDGSSLFMKAGQSNEVSKKIQFAPDGVRVEESSPKRQKPSKSQQDSDDSQIPEEKS